MIVTCLIATTSLLTHVTLVCSDLSNEEQTCQDELDAQRVSLPKSRNPAFQESSWNVGCSHADRTQDVDKCIAKCTASIGCCGVGQNNIQFKCYGNSCSGGSCCPNSRFICQSACRYFPYDTTQFPPPVPQPPPSEPPKPSPPVALEPPLPSAPSSRLSCTKDTDCPQSQSCIYSTLVPPTSRRYLSFGVAFYQTSTASPPPPPPFRSQVSSRY